MLTRFSFLSAGKMNVKDEELEEMLKEGKGPINFTVFLTIFGEKLNGKLALSHLGICSLITMRLNTYSTHPNFHLEC